MNIQEFKARPVVYQALMAVCLVLVFYLLFSFFNRMQYSHDLVRSGIQIVLWIAVTIGFYLVRKWAWIVLAVLMSFSVLGLVHTFVSLRMPFHIFSLIPVAIAILILWGLNRKDMRDLFQVQSGKGRKVAVEVTNFAILCIAIGLFVFIEVLGNRQIRVNPTPVNLFIGFLGFIYILIGTGVWRLNTYAIQAALPILAFTTISLAIALVFDFMRDERFLALGKTIYYIFVSLAMLWYWLKSVRLKLTS